MTLAGIKSWIVRNRLVVAFTLAIFAGYTAGKDLALRDNAREAPLIDMSASRFALEAAV